MVTKQERTIVSEQSRHERRDGVGEIAQHPDGAPAIKGHGHGIGVSHRNEPDESLLTLVIETCGDEVVRDAGWRVDPGANGYRIDVNVRKDRAETPEQGWKLHVSADPTSAEAVLRSALPVLLAEDASFKVVSSVLQLGLLNNGGGGLNQVGKFITVYPKDDEQAVRLAVALDEATRGLH